MSRFGYDTEQEKYELAKGSNYIEKNFNCRVRRKVPEISSDFEGLRILEVRSDESGLRRSANSIHQLSFSTIKM